MKKVCFLCNDINYKILASYNEPDQYEKSVKVKKKNYYRKWVSCTNCNFIYSIYSRNMDALDKLYSSNYRNKNTKWRSKTNEEKFKWLKNLKYSLSETKKRVKWIGNQISLVNKNNIKKKTLLDIGGGTGIFAYEFTRATGFKSSIIDPDPTGKYLEKNYGIKYYCKNYDSKFKKKFDFISLNFVLEHLKNPKKIIKDIKKNMKANSLLYIEVPDSIAFQKKKKNDDIFNSCHLWFFSTESLTRMLENCGYNKIVFKKTKTLRGHYSIMALFKLKKI